MFTRCCVKEESGFVNSFSETQIAFVIGLADAEVVDGVVALWVGWSSGSEGL